MIKTFTIQARYEQSVWDVAIQEHGSIELALNVMSDNSLTPNSELVSGQELSIRETSTVASALMVSETPAVEPRLYTRQAEDEQSIWDMAVQEYGDIQGVLHVMADNDLTPNSELVSGQNMHLRRVPETANHKIMDEFRRKGVRVVCGRGIVQKRGGIGYMQIGYDFIVS